MYPALRTGSPSIAGRATVAWRRTLPNAVQFMDCRGCMTDDRTARSHLTGLGELTRERIDAGLHRTIAPRRPGPPELLDLASNDYLGMHDHPAVIDAAAAALRGYGLGSTGSRLVTGATVAHDELEDELANFMGFGCA